LLYVVATAVFDNALRAQADTLGVTPVATTMVQSRINYSIRRSYLRILPLLDAEGAFDNHDADHTLFSADSPTSAAVRSGGEKRAASTTAADMDEFHRRVHVGTVIEAEMDDTKGGTEWVPGQVQSLNATRATFTAKFKVQSDKETGEWIEEYHWEEMGGEWRFGKVQSKSETKSEPRGKSGVAGSKKSGGTGGGSRSSLLKGVQGSEIVETQVKSQSHKSTPYRDGGKGTGDAAEDAPEDARKLCIGVVIEAEMDDSNGGTEWIQGQVVSIKKTTNSFTVQFNVKNDDETGEWTEEYRCVCCPRAGVRGDGGFSPAAARQPEDSKIR